MEDKLTTVDRVGLYYPTDSDKTFKRPTTRRCNLQTLLKAKCNISRGYCLTALVLGDQGQTVKGAGC